MPDAYATIGLSVVEPSDSGAVMHVRSWVIPADRAEAFAAQMTAVFGQPNEMVSPFEAMTAGAEAAAEKGGAVFMIDSEVRGG
jgi:hypothetical protein